jgi:2-polyprenyl-3-methyl-5-hydroxy-6-metoxy-1,4-benzoquinol methylase
MQNFESVINILKDKKGIEFGGPTQLFESIMPLYSYVDLDGGNIINNNYFQSNLSSNYLYADRVGKQFDADCTNEEQLTKLRRYDFIVTSHAIEHFANPIKTLKLWEKHNLKDGGYVLSIIPDYQYCFDRKRPLTTMEHLIEDYNSNMGEDDTTHIQEQKDLHDWSYGGHHQFYELCEINHLTRVVHHHTFDIELVEEMFDYCGFKKVLSFKHDELNIVNLSKLP